jgi:hypothetical protein
MPFGKTLAKWINTVILAFSMVLRAPKLEDGFSRRATKGGLALLAFTATLLRLEIAPIAVSLALILVYQHRLTFGQATLSGVLGGVSALGEIDFIQPSNRVTH